MKIKPTLVGFSGEWVTMLGLVLIKTRNASISTVKFRQIEYKTGFLSSTLWNIRCSLNPKAQAANKAQQQLRPEPYFPEFLKSRAQASLKFLLISLYLCMNYKGKDTCVTRGVCRNLSRGLIIYLFPRGWGDSSLAGAWTLMEIISQIPGGWSSKAPPPPVRSIIT